MDLKVSPEEAAGEGEEEPEKKAEIFDLKEAKGEEEQEISKPEAVSGGPSPERVKDAAEELGDDMEEDEIKARHKMSFFEMHNPNAGFEPVGEILWRRPLKNSELDMHSDEETKSKDEPRPNLMVSDDSMQRVEEDDGIQE